MNLLERAKQLQSRNEDNPQRVLIYGDSGTGKTTLAALLAEKYKVHFFDIDAGHQALFTALKPEFWQNVELYEVQDVPENPRASKLLDKVMRPDSSVTVCHDHGAVMPCTVCGKSDMSKYYVFSTKDLGPNDVIVVDTMTSHSKSAANFAVGSEIMGGDMAYFKMEFTHHDKQGMILSNFLQRMKRMPCHVVIITHAEILENLNGTKQIAPIGGTRNFAKTARRDFDHIVYCYLKNNKHCFTSSTTHAAGVVAKSRTNVDIKEAADIFKLFATNVIHAAATQVSFTKDDTGGPDEAARPSASVEVVEPVEQSVTEVGKGAVTSTDEVTDTVAVPKAPAPSAASGLAALQARLKQAKL